ncbi:hypothetical protein ASPTUDRAFT_151353 [Aspergillus tubingensis CBS 134.48]|uniref:Heterokaryon incompatibility domain-containing protein n=1 Tax=Aspergillus tubingensis (strain CBS 134.48) TaxID=767770 RepID=A0A1L9MY91_ASPTC|nr:hypothetical protein ASPTUDRAFT_151353 [Aspergillus tubingensis CBS 134.48]
MIRLLPNHDKDKDAEIECELFNYDLTSRSGADSHLYEALSYVWGSSTRSRTIKLNNCAFPVTENLYLALSRLRNRQLERTLWVDAICIDQSNRDEKAKQIPLMRTIYAQAQHVIVWLGEAYENGDKALEALRCLAEGQDVDIRGCGALCVKLFERAWFRRIWVLQEVGVALHIYIMCGSAQINGYAFCEGLKRLDRHLDCQELIGPVAFLIKGALVRPKYEPGSRGTLTIGELVGMYCYHNATEKHDKIYALLGLSADPMTPALTPNYVLPWNQVFKQVTNYIFPDCSVETWPGSDIVIIRGKGRALGHICSVQRVSDFGQQKVKVYLNDTARSIGYESEWEASWELQTFAQTFKPGDIIFLLQGDSKPSVIRLCKDHFRIITPAVTLCKRRPRESPEGTSRRWHTLGGSCDILLAWRIPLNNDTRSQKWPETELLDMVPAYQGQSLEAEYRRNNITRIMASVAMGALALKKPEDKDIAHLLATSGTDDSIASRLTKASAKDIRCFPDKRLQIFFPCEQDDLSISEEMVKSVAENIGPCGYIIIELLFQLQGGNLPISEEVVEAAARNSGDYGHLVMKTIYRHRGEFFPISEKAVMAAAGNTGKRGTKLLKLLFKSQGEALPVSEEVIKAAAMSDEICGHEIFKIIVRHGDKHLLVSEEVCKSTMGNTRWGDKNLRYLVENWERKVHISEGLLIAAARNNIWGHTILEILFQHGEASLQMSEEVLEATSRNNFGHRILELLFRHGLKTPPISEEVIKAMAGHLGGELMLELLFQYTEEKILISEDVVKEAAGNRMVGDRVLHLLFQKEGNRLPVTEEVVKTAAGNYHGHSQLKLLFQHRGVSLAISEKVVEAAAGNGDNGHAVMELLFQQKGEKLPVTEEVVKTAAGNDHQGHKIMECLLQQKGKSLPVTEEVVKRATGNELCGDYMMELLFRQRGEKLPVTEDVVKAAAGNEIRGDRIMELLFQQRGERLPVTEDVVKAAAENLRCRSYIMELLFQQRGGILPVTEEVSEAAAEDTCCGSTSNSEIPESAESAESAESSDSSDSTDHSQSSARPESSENLLSWFGMVGK